MWARSVSHHRAFPSGSPSTTDALTVSVMSMLAILGFVTIGVFLALVTLTRTPVIVALVLAPLATAWREVSVARSAPSRLTA